MYIGQWTEEYVHISLDGKINTHSALSWQAFNDTVEFGCSPHVLIGGPSNMTYVTTHGEDLVNIDLFGLTQDVDSSLQDQGPLLVNFINHPNLLV